MEDILFTNVNILDCSGRDPYLGEVLLRGNRIKSVGQGNSSVARNGCRVIDGRRAFLMPGLVLLL